MAQEMIFSQFVKSSHIWFHEIFGKMLSNNKSNFDLKKSSLHSVLLVHSLKPPLWSFLNWLYRGLSDKTALKWEKENNFKWGITWLYIAAAVKFSGLSHYFFSDFFACSYASTDTQKSIFWEQIILCQKWDNVIYPNSIF